MKENVYMYLRVATKEQVSGCIKCDSHNSKEKRKNKDTICFKCPDCGYRWEVYCREN